LDHIEKKINHQTSGQLQEISIWRTCGFGFGILGTVTVKTPSKADFGARQ